MCISRIVTFLEVEWQMVLRGKKGRRAWASVRIRFFEWVAVAAEEPHLSIRGRVRS
jgi:hypothetical protein